MQSILYDFKFIRGSGNELYLPRVTEETQQEIEDSGIRMRNIQRTASLHDSGTEEPPTIFITTTTESTNVIELTEITVLNKDGDDTMLPVYIPPTPDIKVLLDDEEILTEL